MSAISLSIDIGSHSIEVCLNQIDDRWEYHFSPTWHKWFDIPAEEINFTRLQAAAKKAEDESGDDNNQDYIKAERIFIRALEQKPILLGP